MEEKERYEIHRYTLQANEKISFNDYTEHICEHYDFNFEKIKPFTTRIQDLLNQQDKENQQLKQQLEEKDKEISNLNGLVRERDKQIKNLKTNKKRVIEHKNKTKISFALEQLEKVKENIKKVPITDFDLSGNFEKMYKQDAIRQIDNQIKELKGEE